MLLIRVEVFGACADGTRLREKGTADYLVIVQSSKDWPCLLVAIGTNILVFSSMIIMT